MDIRSADIEEGVVRILWSDGRRSRFHLAWLRDNCPCAICSHPETMELTHDQTLVADDVEASIASIVNGALHITWRVHLHKSAYDPAWLRAHDYSDAERERRRARATAWRRPMATHMPTFSYRDVMSDDGALLEWLRAVRDTGLAMLRSVPTRRGEVGRVAKRVAFVQQTNFGVIFDVRPKASPTSNAYTPLALHLHTDLPHHAEPPGFQFLHCLRNDVEGGESLFADGFQIAAELRMRDPAAFELLTRFPISFRYQDTVADHRHRGPMLVLDPDGEFRMVRFAPNVVAPLDVPFDRTLQVRRAYRAFASLVASPAFQERLRLSAGSLVVTDNHRVLHGRTAFDQSSGRRHLQGCYVSRSEWLSRIHVLERSAAAGRGWLLAKKE